LAPVTYLPIFAGPGSGTRLKASSKSARGMRRSVRLGSSVSPSRRYVNQSPVWVLKNSPEWARIRSQHSSKGDPASLIREMLPDAAPLAGSAAGAGTGRRALRLRRGVADTLRVRKRTGIGPVLALCMLAPTGCDLWVSAEPVADGPCAPGTSFVVEVDPQGYRREWCERRSAPEGPVAHGPWLS